MATAIQACLKTIVIETRAEDILASMTRKDIAKKLIAGEEPREQEVGFVIKADIKGSSAIATEHGTLIWTRFIDRIKPGVGSIGKKYGFVLQLVVWDAFHFTKAVRVSATELTLIVQLCTELNAFLDFALNRNFSANMETHPQDRARFCIEFGDITRAINYNTWTIVGESMFNVSKLEEACKNLPGTIFTSDRVLNNISAPFFQPTEVTIGGTGRQIYRYLFDLEVIDVDLELLPEDETVKAA